MAVLLPFTVPAVSEGNPSGNPPTSNTEGTKVGDRVMVTYYNVEVPVLVDTATLNDMGEFEASVPITIGGTAVATPPMINVRYRHPSTIEVSTAPSALKPLAVAHVTVRYKVQEAVIGFEYGLQLSCQRVGMQHIVHQRAKILRIYPVVLVLRF